MSSDTIIQHLTTITVLFFMYLLIHSKIKKQSFKESYNEIKEFFQNMMEGDTENE